MYCSLPQVCISQRGLNVIVSGDILQRKGVRVLSGLGQKSMKHSMQAGIGMSPDLDTDFSGLGLSFLYSGNVRFSSNGAACVPDQNTQSRESEVKEAPDRRWIFDCTNTKAKALSDDLHRYVVSQHFRGHAV
jgi:hypothetical protein